MATMQAVICTAYGSPDVLRLDETFKKPVPRADEVLVKIHATAVTASDCIVRGFALPPWKPIGFMMGLVVGFGKPRNPILGMVAAGEVEAIGNDVSTYAVHDKVMAITGTRFGCYAQYVALPAEKKKPRLPIARPGVMTSMPPELSYTEAAALPYGGMLAGFYLRQANIQLGQHVLIYGASGAIGTTAIQLAKHQYGAEVTAVCSTRNLELVQSLGADHVLDYTTQDTPPAGVTYDVMLDAVGMRKTSALRNALMALFVEGGNFVSVDHGTPEAEVQDLDVLRELVAAGKYQPVIDRTYPLHEIAEAHRYVDSGHKRGNVVITVPHR